MRRVIGYAIMGPVFVLAAAAAVVLWAALEVNDRLGSWGPIR